MRIALGIEYDGSRYYGWQAQAKLLTVQGEVERALSCVADHQVEVTCAGRTDAGVHAVEQVVHFDTQSLRSMRAWVLGTNSNLPDDIRILWAEEVADNFNARYSAVARTYRYVICEREVAPALLRRRMMWCYEPLNEKLMQMASRCLLGEQDFSSFRGSGCQSRSPMRRVMHVTVKRQRKLVIIEIQANAFLLHMVRNIVGSLVTIGLGEHEPEWLEQVLHARDRRLAAATAPASGLYLVQVHYPELKTGRGRI